jgi:probable F420-dependent oxidoreductase
VRIGVLPPYRAGVGADPDWLTGFAQTAESVGVESLYVVEHVAVAAGYGDAYPYSRDGRMPLPEDCPLPDPLETVAFLAARTTALRFGTGVLVGPHHHPLALAKRLVTLDALSGGRVDVGVGVGWMREEVEATGASFTTRGRRTTELLAALRTALDDDPASFEGEFFSFSGMRVHPRPTRYIRLDVGGHAEAAAVRAGMVGDGLHPLGVDDETLAARWDLARRTAGQHGRDPDGLELTITLPLAGVDRAAVDRARRAGVSRIVCSTALVDRAELAAALAAVVQAAG